MKKLVLIVFTLLISQSSFSKLEQNNSLFDQFGVILEGSNITSLGGHSGGGGEIVAMEFVSMAYDIYLNLVNDPILVYNFKSEDYLYAIRNTRIIGRDESLYDKNGEQVDALNFPELRVIIVNEKAWREKSVSSKIKKQLIFHEYLGIMAANNENSPYNDENYRVSVLLNNRDIPINYPSSTKGNVDILFVIDNSGSMAPMQEKLKNNIDILLSKFLPKNPRVGILTSESYSGDDSIIWGLYPSNPYSTTWGVSKHFSPFDQLSIEKLKATITGLGTHGNANEKFYGPVVHALRDQHNSDFFRSNTDLILIFLTDEDEQTKGLTNDIFLTEIKKMYDLSRVSIYPLIPGDGSVCVSPEITYPKFKNIVTDPRINKGKVYNICEDSWINFQF